MIYPLMRFHRCRAGKGQEGDREARPTMIDDRRQLKPGRYKDGEERVDSEFILKAEM